MIPALILLIAAVLCALAAHKLCGDRVGAVLAGFVFALSPSVRILAGADIRTAAALALLPALLLLFYRLNEIPTDLKRSRRLNILAVGLVLDALGILDTRLAAAGGLTLWIIVLTGYAMDHRRRWLVWGPVFLGWGFSCLAGIALYLPVWLWRRYQPGALGGPPPFIPEMGADFVELWLPSPFYSGIIAALLALAALIFSRSYRGQVRLWAILAGLMLWMSLGERFLFAGKYSWWVPALYRGASKLPWLKEVPPIVFGALGQLALGILAAFGLGALLTSLPPKSLRWARPLAAFLAAALITADYLRIQPLIP